MQIELSEKEIKFLRGTLAGTEKRMWKLIDQFNRETKEQEDIIKMLVTEADKANVLGNKLAAYLKP